MGEVKVCTGGLITRLHSPEVIERCLELLEKLRRNLKQRGFDIERERNVLTIPYRTDLKPQDNHRNLPGQSPTRNAWFAGVTDGNVSAA